MRDSRHVVLHFWFDETDPVLWYQVNEEFDRQIKERFYSIYQLAAEGLCDNWRQDAEGALALCLLLDQFPRMMFRGQPEAFATDKKALLVAKNAIAKGLDQVQVPLKRRFLYLPFQHSEKLVDQKQSLTLFKSIQRDDPAGYEQAQRFYHEVDRFDRIPGRNKILGRANTPEEEDYLAL